MRFLFASALLITAVVAVPVPQSDRCVGAATIGCNIGRIAGDVADSPYDAVEAIDKAIPVDEWVGDRAKEVGGWVGDRVEEVDEAADEAASSVQKEANKVSKAVDQAADSVQKEAGKVFKAVDSQVKDVTTGFHQTFDADEN